MTKHSLLRAIVCSVVACNRNDVPTKKFYFVKAKLSLQRVSLRKEDNRAGSQSDKESL